MRTLGSSWWPMSLCSLEKMLWQVWGCSPTVHFLLCYELRARGLCSRCKTHKSTACAAFGLCSKQPAIAHGSKVARILVVQCEAWSLYLLRWKLGAGHNAVDDKQFRRLHEPGPNRVQERRTWRFGKVMADGLCSLACLHCKAQTTQRMDQFFR